MYTRTTVQQVNLAASRLALFRRLSECGQSGGEPVFVARKRSSAIRVTTTPANKGIGRRADGQICASDCKWLEFTRRCVERGGSLRQQHRPPGADGSLRVRPAPAAARDLASRQSRLRRPFSPVRSSTCSNSMTAVIPGSFYSIRPLACLNDPTSIVLGNAGGTFPDRCLYFR